ETFSYAVTMYPLTTRAMPLIFSEAIGLRLCGIAEEPVCPFRKNSSTSLVSVFCNPLISVANFSIDVAMSASTDIYAACRSRCNVCVDNGAGVRPNCLHTYSSTNGSIFAYVPTAPDNLPYSTRSAASLNRSKRSEEHTSELQSRFELVCRLLLEKKNKYNIDQEPAQTAKR